MDDSSSIRKDLFELFFHIPFEDRKQLDVTAQGKLAPNLVRKIIELLDSEPGVEENTLLDRVIIIPKDPAYLSRVRTEECLTDLAQIGIIPGPETKDGLRFIDPKNPDAGVLFILLPLSIPQIKAVMDLPWVRRLELPDVAWIDNTK